MNFSGEIKDSVTVDEEQHFLESMSEVAMKFLESNTEFEKNDL